MEQTSPPFARPEWLRAAMGVFLLAFLVIELFPLTFFAKPGLEKVRGLYALLLVAGSALLLHGLWRRAAWFGAAAVAFFALQVVFDPMVQFVTSLGERFEVMDRIENNPMIRMSIDVAGGKEEFLGRLRSEILWPTFRRSLLSGVPVCAALFVLLRWPPVPGGAEAEALPSAVRHVAGIVEAAAERHGAMAVAVAALVVYVVLFVAATWLALL